MDPQIRRPQGVAVTYRKMKFDFEDSGFDRYYHGGSAFKSLFWTQLSTAFEPGEAFFIDAARAFRKQLRDPALRRELTDFCKQEGHHTAQHLKFDRVNERMGVDVATCRARYDAILSWCRQTHTPLMNLATTVALEHFTSCFADQFFANPEISAGVAPEVLALWGWHAAEESEHRGTCFDIYTAVGGGYAQRLAHLLASWSIILGISLVNTLELLQRDGQLFTRDTLTGMAYLFGRKGIVTGLLPAFFTFWNPRFHPWSHVDGSDIQRWLADNHRYITNPA